MPEESELRLTESELWLRESEAKIAKCQEAFKESYKLRYDTFKSQNVLCSGAVVAFGGITVGLIHTPVHLWLLMIAYILVFASMIFTMIIMHRVAVDMLISLSPPVRSPHHPEP